MAEFTRAASLGRREHLRETNGNAKLPEKQLQCKDMRPPQDNRVLSAQVRLARVLAQGGGDGGGAAHCCEGVWRRRAYAPCKQSAARRHKLMESYAGWS
jgi:hypothetical protein